MGTDEDDDSAVVTYTAKSRSNTGWNRGPRLGNVVDDDDDDDLFGLFR